MIAQNVFYDTSVLPGNILSLVDDNFYDFVEQRLGVAQSSLLKLQQINSVPCLLLTSDPCEILNLNIDDNDLYLLREKMCFVLSDGSFVVKPGVRTGFKCLHEFLIKQTEEKLKQSRTTKIQFPTAPPINILTSPPSSFLTSSITTTISTSQATTTPGQQQTTTAQQQSPTTPLPHPVPSTSISEHRKYVLNLLKQWCFDHKNDFNLDSFDLKQGTDFMLYVIHNRKNDLEASIKCTCGRMIVLTLKNGKIQLSNYQKHLRTATCTHMNSLKKMQEKGKKSNPQQTTSGLSSSAAVASAAAAPQQQQKTILQAPVLLSPGGSSAMIPATSDTQSTISQTNLRKRSHPSSQLASSQKTKRLRT